MLQPPIEPRNRGPKGSLSSGVDGWWNFGIMAGTLPLCLPTVDGFTRECIILDLDNFTGIHLLFNGIPMYRNISPLKQSKGPGPDPITWMAQWCVYCVQYALEEGGGPGVLPARPYLHCQQMIWHPLETRNPPVYWYKLVMQVLFLGNLVILWSTYLENFFLGRKGGAMIRDLQVDGPILPESGKYNNILSYHVIYP